MRVEIIIGEREKEGGGARGERRRTTRKEVE